MGIHREEEALDNGTERNYWNFLWHSYKVCSLFTLGQNVQACTQPIQGTMKVCLNQHELNRS